MRMPWCECRLPAVKCQQQREGLRVLKLAEARLMSSSFSSSGTPTTTELEFLLEMQSS